ncbi:LytR/AlgR family response regulator transcription factor [Rhodohalobacter mucosus]|uniref:DNA-binding response regulator n=1 Tax=Rhodohalobacter mucosus TaxID=2079485 RepID=A0A316TRR9_9BACT|nr:LytTR family DNA-binding domain-containing protein [Rhodohalobacter mucosus]PWN06321.1 DNA-binding response regulator [Rhodohalobacter mucosus]
MIRCILVDDEPLAHELLNTYCDRLPHLEVVADCYDAMEALEWLSSNRADLMFLDLNMPKLKGFDFLRTLQNPPKVIVTTAYNEHALEGFELAVADYLVKPFSFERFLKAVNRAVSAVPDPRPVVNDNHESGPNTGFFIKGDNGYYRIDMRELLYVEASGNYCKVNLTDGQIVVHEKISDLEEQLPADRFIRIHRSFIVALDKIKTLHSDTVTVGETEISIGQTYSKAVRDVILKRE